MYAVGWLKCCFTSTETVGLIGTGAQDGHLDFHTASELCGVYVSMRIVYIVTWSPDYNYSHLICNSHVQIHTRAHITHCYTLNGVYSHNNTKTSLFRISHVLSDILKITITYTFTPPPLPRLRPQQIQIYFFLRLFFSPNTALPITVPLPQLKNPDKLTISEIMCLYRNWTNMISQP